MRTVVRKFNLPGRDRGLVRLGISVPVRALGSLTLSKGRLLSLLNVRHNNPFINRVFRRLGALILTGELRGAPFTLESFVAGEEVVCLSRAFRISCAIKGGSLTVRINSNALPILTAPTLLTVVRGTYVKVIGRRLTRKSAAMKVRYSLRRGGTSPIGTRVAIAIEIARREKGGCFFRYTTHSRNRRVTSTGRAETIIGTGRFVRDL